MPHIDKNPTTGRWEKECSKGGKIYDLGITQKEAEDMAFKYFSHYRDGRGYDNGDGFLPTCRICVLGGRWNSYSLICIQKYTIYECQRGKCAFCNESLSIEEAHVEHDHITNRVRGLVHKTCNNTIARYEPFIKETYDKERYAEVKAYLNRR